MQTLIAPEYSSRVVFHHHRLGKVGHQSQEPGPLEQAINGKYYAFDQQVSERERERERERKREERERGRERGRERERYREREEEREGEKERVR